MDRPTGSSHLAFSMAALVAAGGVAGFVSSKSRASLVAGLGIAAAYGLGGHQINVSRGLRWGFRMASPAGLQRTRQRSWFP